MKFKIMKGVKNIIFVLLVFAFGCESSPSEENLEVFLEAESSEINLLYSHGSFGGKSFRSKSKDKFEISNINNAINIKYLSSRYYSDSVDTIELNDNEIDTLILILKEAVKSHDNNKEYIGCCMCSNIDFYLTNNRIKMEVKPSKETEYLFYNFIEKINTKIPKEEFEYGFNPIITITLDSNRINNNDIETKEFKNNFIELFKEDGVFYLIEDSMYFTFDFDLHGFDCRAPDCYSTFVEFSLPAMDSIVFPTQIKVKEYTTGCVEDETISYYIFQLGESSGKYLIYNSIKAKKSLVLNVDFDEYRSKAYYFSNANTPVTLKNVEGLLEYDENTKECEMPYTSTRLVKKI